MARDYRIKNERQAAVIDEIRKALESNKNFMWGKGTWSVISKTKKALAQLDKETP